MANPLKVKRLSLGYTQAQIARKVGITERGYRRYEANDTSKGTREPGVLTAIRIADALGVQDLRELWKHELNSF